MTLKTIIVDDEQPERERLKMFIREYGNLEVIAEVENGTKAVELINSLKPELVFLDIQIPGLNGFQVIKQINARPAIIFVTAYDEYAIEAFEVNAIDYLLKPYSKQRFKISMERILNEVKNHSQNNTDYRQLTDWYNRKTEYIRRISFKVKNVYNIIDINEILFFKLENGAVYLYTESKKHPVKGTLNGLEKSIDPTVFFRANRISIINLSMIKRVLPWGQNRFAAEFANNERIVISRERGKVFKKKVGLRFI